MKGALKVNDWDGALQLLHSQLEGEAAVCRPSVYFTTVWIYVDTWSDFVVVV